MLKYAIFHLSTFQLFHRSIVQLFSSHHSMKNYFLLSMFTVLLLTGCASKSNILLPFDTFTIKFYNNDKQYIALPLQQSTSEMKTIYQMKEQTIQDDTWFINSLIINKIPIQSWLDITTLMTANIKTLQGKLLKYSTITATEKKVKCETLQDSWYINAFSYQFDNQTLYGGQYTFIDSTSLYSISLASDNEEDINRFIKSIRTIKCL